MWKGESLTLLHIIADNPGRPLSLRGKLGSHQTETNFGTQSGSLAGNDLLCPLKDFLCIHAITITYCREENKQ